MIDLRSIFYSYLIIEIVCTSVVIQLWLHNRKRFEGTAYWLLDFIFQTLALILVALRGQIPDIFSIILANTFAIGGILLGLIGLEKFLGLKSKQFYNFIFVFAFIITHLYLTYIKPDLTFRILNLSVALIIFSVQYVWLIFIKLSAEKRKIAIGVGIVFAFYSLLHIATAIRCLFIKILVTDVSQPSNFQIFTVTCYEVLFILLIYNISIMVNKRLLGELAVEEEKFSQAFHATPYAIILSKYNTGEILEVNRGFQNITGYQYEDIVGKTINDIQLWTNIDHKKLHWGDNLKFEPFFEEEIQFRKKTGEMNTALLSLEMISVGNEKCTLSAFYDITKRKEVELALRNSESELGKSNETKDKFLSIIAHDLKTPFNSILGFSELLLLKIHESDTDKIEKFARQINSSADRTLSLLENLLDWANSQTGKIEFCPEILSLTEIIKELVVDFNSPALIKKIKINNYLTAELPLFADKNMIKTILRNIIANAIKFTKTGGTIDIHVISHLHAIEIIVKDNGIGMDESILSRLFKLDSNLTTQGTAMEKGSGLGLILCKEFVEKHQGKIWVESEIEQGSLFHISFPA